MKAYWNAATHHDGKMWEERLFFFLENPHYLGVFKGDVIYYKLFVLKKQRIEEFGKETGSGKHLLSPGAILSGVNLGGGTHIILE